MIESLDVTLTNIPTRWWAMHKGTLGTWEDIAKVPCTRILLYNDEFPTQEAVKVTYTRYMMYFRWNLDPMEHVDCLKLIG